MSIPYYAGLLKDALALILAGGRGERLFPLTSNRTKGAVPFGGLYRLVDFTLTNCLHSDLRRICILPQYRFASLEQHLWRGWHFLRPELGENLSIIPPQQRVSAQWYKGTADAVYQNIYTLEQEAPRHVIILSSDHLYRMDYRHLLDHHIRNSAALTIACMEIKLEEAHRFGVMSVDPDGRIVAFEEKPAAPRGIPGRPDCALASMGIYVFDIEALVQVLTEDAEFQESRHDFGHDVIPRMVAGEWRVSAYDAHAEDGVDFYWRDIGTIDAYWEASMELLSRHPPFDLYDTRWPIHTCQQALLPARLYCGDTATWICPGATVDDARVHRSILSPGATVGSGAEVVDSILMDGVQIGPGARVRRAIVDKNARIPAGYRLGVDLDADRERFHVSPGGIAVIPKGAELVARSHSS